MVSLFEYALAPNPNLLIFHHPLEGIRLGQRYPSLMAEGSLVSYKIYLVFIE